MAFFDPTRPSYIANPYPSLARLRRDAPVFHWRAFSSWVVTGYDECVAVLNDAETYRTDPVQVQSEDEGVRTEEMRRRGELLGGVTRLVSTDAPDHTRRRGIVTRAFASRAVDERRAAIEQHVRALLDRVESGRPFDLMEVLARPLPPLVIADQLGVAPEDYETVVEGARNILDATNPFAPPEVVTAGHAAREALVAYLERCVSGEVPARGGEVIAAMAAATTGGELTADELLALTVDLVTAGNRAVEMGIGCSVLALLRHPEQLALPREDPMLIPDAVEELLRFETPAQALPWFTAHPTQLGGHRIEVGEKLFALIGAANRDPAVFDDPDRLDLLRRPRRHVAFGAGVHTCLGASLARLELTVALEGLFARFETLRLAAPRVSLDSGFMHRGPAQLLLIAEALEHDAEHR